MRAMPTILTDLCLPAEVVARLGLRLNREAMVETPAGVHALRIFEGARVTYRGRDARVDVIELAPRSRPLFGVIPMETLGVEPDTRSRTVRVLPESANESFLRV